MDETLAEPVWDRAGSACEYCLIPQAFYPAPFEIDHIIARQHQGLTRAGNLALSCIHCNSHKGPNIAGRDPVTRKLTPLLTRAGTDGRAISAGTAPTFVAKLPSAG
jgi:hypothetical protein